MTFDRFTQRAGKALNLALQSAAELGHSYIGTEHLLLGLLRAQDGVELFPLTIENREEAPAAIAAWYARASREKRA